VWWINISHAGKRIQRSTGTSNKVEAQQFHDKLKADLWRVERLNHKPAYTWLDAVLRWLEEAQHKRSIDHDKKIFRWLDPYLRKELLSKLNRDFIDQIARKKEESGAAAGTVNRMLALIRSILRKAESQWGWIEKAPVIRMRSEQKGRIRWLTKTEAFELLKELPEHLADMMLFTLATGLRHSNVVGLRWQEVNFNQCHALVHPDQSKSKKAIPVPLNEDAILILRKQLGKNTEFVFSYGGKPVKNCNTRAWRNALKRAGIVNFRWHDLRHTWASWHVQNGTSLYELQQLGGWSNFDMVMRYSHLSSDHLRSAAKRISVTNLLQVISPNNQSVI
jgi:integrase